MTPTVLVPFTDGMQLEFVYTLGGKVCTNRVWLWSEIGGPDQAEVDATVAAAADFWVAGLMPLLSADLVLTLVRGAVWTDPLSPITSAVFPNVAGSVLEPSHSANVAIRVSFRWPLFKHRKVNGNYVPGIPEGSVDTNTFSDALRSGLFDHYVALIDAARTWGSGDNWWWVCVSLVDAGALRSEMDFGLCIGPTVVTPYVTQQRHRLRV